MNSLRLKPIKEQTFSIYSFENENPKQGTLPVAELMINPNVDKDIKIKARRTIQINSPLQKFPLKLKNQKNLKQQLEFVDTLPSQTEIYTLLLIANDQFYDIMLDEQKKIQEKLYKLKSKLGWIISRKTRTIEWRHDESNVSTYNIKSNTN